MEDRRRPRRSFPWGIWALALLTLAAACVFFLLPRILGEREMRIQFSPTEQTR
ncbi:MAG: hypothetical protein IH851_07180 [Armatimonadetes bacterium]|nr:hypothetical protein [Armatimonadota bacterium]